MRKLFLFLFVLSFSALVRAQFGYYSNSNVIQALPSYKEAAADYERLCKRCEKEIEHNERELTRQYVAFLDGYRDFPEPILRKRQNELQRLVDNSVNFRKELKEWLAVAKDSLFAPSRNVVAMAVQKVSEACNLDYVIDIDEAAYKYINPNKAIDITRMLLDAALFPDKPVTKLDGYDCYLKTFKPAVQPATEVTKPAVADETVVSAANDDVLIDTECAATEESEQQE